MNKTEGHVPEIYFHAGLPKTATTFLQRKVFPVFDGIQFVKKHHFRFHERITTHTHEKAVLFSNEYDRGIEDVLKMFAEKYPNAKIILSFRRHDRWIESKYRYHIRKNGKLSFDEFCDVEHDNGVWNSSNMTFMNYVRLVEKYFDTPPFLIFQDNLKNDPFGEFDRIADYVGATYKKEDISLRIVKKSYNDKQLYCVRKFNRTFNGYNEDKYPPGFMRKLHRKSRALFLHGTAYLGLLVPRTMVPDAELVPTEKLALVRERYTPDWKDCLEYAKKHTG